jgi:F-type H+-transporting ATPase subunit b
MLLASAHAATESAGGVAALGLDGGALLFQLINFGLLLLLLRAFAYKPVLRVLEARRQRVEESLRSAAEIEKAKTALDRHVKQATEAAQREAQAVVAASQARAETLVKEAEERAREASDRIADQATARLSQQVTAARQELKEETLRLVAAAAGRILAERLDTQRDQELVTEAVHAAEQHIARKEP